MQQHISQLREQRNIQVGMTLLELIIACGILLVLSSAALPLARMTIKRTRETELRRDLRELRDAVDRYKDAADKNLIRIEVGSEGGELQLITVRDYLIQAGIAPDRVIAVEPPPGQKPNPRILLRVVP